MNKGSLYPPSPTYIQSLYRVGIEPIPVTVASKIPFLNAFPIPFVLSKTIAQ